MTLDALHSCPETVRLITELGADCAMPVRDSWPTLLEDIRLLDWDSVAECKTSEKDRGRVETRRCRAIALDGFPDELAALPGRRQAFRSVRERQVVRTEKTSVQTVFGLSSPGPERAGPEELPALNRGHWAIENRLRHVRDVSYDEDRLRIRSGRSLGQAERPRPNKRAPARNDPCPTGTGHPQLLPNRRKNASLRPPERSLSAHSPS